MSQQHVIPALIFEDELDLKEEEILSACCRLVKHQGNVTARILGILDPNSFLAACTAHKEREDEGVERTRERAEEAYQLWSNVVDSTYLFVEPGEPTFRSSLTTSTH
ncbi:hypothetical protein Bca101_044653 [Brassica carinata]